MDGGGEYGGKGLGGGEGGKGNCGQLDWEKFVS